MLTSFVFFYNKIIILQISGENTVTSDTSHCDVNGELVQQSDEDNGPSSYCEVTVSEMETPQSSSVDRNTQRPSNSRATSEPGSNSPFTENEDTDSITPKAKRRKFLIYFIFIFNSCFLLLFRRTYKLSVSGYIGNRRFTTKHGGRDNKNIRSTERNASGRQSVLKGNATGRSKILA